MHIKKELEKNCDFCLLSIWKEYGCGDNFHFDHEPNGLLVDRKNNSPNTHTESDSVLFRFERDIIVTLLIVTL